MRIPLDHFSSVPVFALSPPGNSPEPESPSLVATIKDKMSSLTPDLSVFYSNSSAGSAPSSPVSRRKMSATSQNSTSASSRPSSAGPVSLPVFTSQGPGCAPVSR